ncbi:MAG TPA: phage holin family protein [Gemmatimonadaceae bacterium]|nr:phage holin family protein [Gemmatimonadaceae bacterium]
MPTGRENGRGIGVLLRDLADGGAALLRQELRLARVEVTGIVEAVGMGTALTATGAVLALLGAFALVLGLIMLAGDQWLRDRYWLAALIGAVIAGGIAAWMARRGAAHLSPHRLLPDETMATLKEDKEWLKRQLKSGATSR